MANISAGRAWYRLGTANTTQGSPVVTGVGTQWESGGIREGDIFMIEGSRIYEIASVNGNQNLTLREPFAGLTRVQQDYAIIQNFSTNMLADLARRLSVLVAQYEENKG